MPYSYHTLTAALASVGIEEARGEALLLLERFAHATPATLMADRHHIYDSPELNAAVERRLTRYPLQYILGEWEFCGLTFTVNEHCLIPRPDTEILVEEAIRTLPPNAHVADLCTGSGCIAVSVLCHRPDVTVHALELFPETLSLAVHNAERNGVAPRFNPICADLLGEGVDILSKLSPLDAILSNPPYIPTAVVSGLSPEVHTEPHAALDGGEDGLVFYRAILRDYAPMVKPGGLIILEIGYDQGKALATLQQTYIPKGSISILQDLGGNDRVAVIKMPE